MLKSIFYDAKAHIKGGKEYPSINGYIYFREISRGVVLTAKIKGLPLSQNKCNGRIFGLHIHERNILYRKCR